ncbi:unnamed protein product [Sphagnum tenellum]
MSTTLSTNVTDNVTVATKAQKSPKSQISIPVQRQMREQAINHFFPNDNLKEITRAFYSDSSGDIVAEIRVAQPNLKGKAPRFWFGFRLSHLNKIATAKRAYFVFCGKLNDQVIQFALPVMVFNGVPYLCNQPLTSLTAKQHYNVSLVLRSGIWVVDFHNGNQIDATQYALRRVWVNAHTRALPTLSQPHETQEELRQMALPATTAAFDLVNALIADFIDQINAVDPTVRLEFKFIKV